MNAATRHRLLAAALLATLAAAWLAPDPDSGGGAVAALAPMPVLRDWPQAPELQAPMHDATSAAATSGAPGRPSRAASRGEPGAADTPAAVAAAPRAPPPPFRMFGRIERDGETIAFLSHAGRTLTAAAGDRLPGDWQLDSVSSDGAVLTYLPLGQTARIPFKANPQ